MRACCRMGKGSRKPAGSGRRQPPQVCHARVQSHRDLNLVPHAGSAVKLATVCGCRTTGQAVLRSGEVCTGSAQKLMTVLADNPDASAPAGPAGLRRSRRWWSPYMPPKHCGRGSEGKFGCDPSPVRRLRLAPEALCFCGRLVFLPPVQKPTAQPGSELRCCAFYGR